MNFLLVLIIYLTTFVNCQPHRSKRAAIGPKWPTKKIPFSFENISYFNPGNKLKIKQALKLMQDSLSVNGETCVEFVERTNEIDYVEFVKQNGCFTYVGYRPGKNIISLGPNCVSTGIVMHEMVHKLGFDHEHSRSDRDQNVKVFFNNTNEKPQFQLVNAVNEANLEAPYDFHSIIHYTTYQGSNNIFKINPVLLSRLPVLISTANEIEFERELLTPIDVYKIQRFYNCSTIKATDIQYEPSEGLDKDRFENILRRFTLETHFKGVSEDVVTKYLNLTIKTCGFNHYWPVNYPIVEENHPLYKLMCVRKKKKFDKCKLSFECLDETTVCLRPLYWPNGFCMRSENTKFNQLIQKSHDVFISLAQKLKNVFSRSL